MSWSFRAIGLPDNLRAALDVESGKLGGDSREEFDAAKPHLQALIAMNVNGSYPSPLEIDASGHAGKTDGKISHSTCSVNIRGLGSRLVSVLLCLLLFTATALGAESPRSGHWPAARAAYLAEHPACEACGRSIGLTVHHVIPFHVDPSRELDPSNLITLCERCHLVFGHLGDYQSYNPAVRRDATAYLARRLTRPPRGPVKILPPAIRHPVGAAVRRLVA